MKKFFKIFLIFCTCIFLSSCFAGENNLMPKTGNPHYPTQADMLNYSHEQLDKLMDRYNKICDKLEKNFHKDKEFVQALHQNKTLYIEYRKSEPALVLPKRNTEYGSNYGINSDSIIIKSTENQIKNLRNLVENYCIYNDYYYDKNACQSKTLDKIFK